MFVCAVFSTTGPNSYDTSCCNAIRAKSFNKAAIESMRMAAETLTPHRPPGSRPSHSSAVTATDRGNSKGPRGNMTVGRSGGTGRQRHVVEASAFLAERAGLPVPTLTAPPPVSKEGSRSSSLAGSESAVGRSRRPPRLVVPDDPPVHVSKQEVRKARDVFGGILKTTKKILKSTPEPAVLVSDDSTTLSIRQPES